MSPHDGGRCDSRENSTIGGSLSRPHHHEAASAGRIHIHAIVEAKNASALARAVQGFSIRVSKGLNRLLGRRGAASADRYHVHILQTPREVRNALAYVLNNARRHAAKCGQYVAGTFVDPFSTWALFDGTALAPFDA